LWSFINPAHEQLIRAVIQEEYPDRYLGNMPILLSSEVQPKWHEYPRTNVVILSAYLHTEMTEQLSALGEELRDYAGAVQVLQRALELEPDNLELKRGLAQDLVYAGKLDDAIQAYTEVAEADPKAPRLYSASLKSIARSAIIPGRGKHWSEPRTCSRKTAVAQKRK
jgi:tetratricopeptide (TPR) repeat protein